MDAANRLENFLLELASSAEPGDRLPPVRTLMSRFGVSQSVVQRVTAKLKADGKISAEIGRGTFFSGGASSQSKDQPARSPLQPSSRSVLILRRSVSIQRGRRVLEELQRLLTTDGHRVVEVSYTDAEDADVVLRGLPRFDACMIQSSFETISVETLSAIRRKTQSIVVDGAALAGTEVDAVGLEWGQSVSLALDLLRKQGHRKIGMIVTQKYLLAVELGRRRFIEEMRRAEDIEAPPIIYVPAWPHEDYEKLAAEQISMARRANGTLPFSGLVVWGIESGKRFRTLLAERHIEIPRDLSVVLLGRTDLENEHDGFFTTVGPKTLDQIAGLYQVITNRWATPDQAHRTYLLEANVRSGESVTPPVN